MSDSDKPTFFDDKKKALVLDWINSKCKGGKFQCECCGSDDWDLSEDMVSPLTFAGGFAFGNAYPSVIAICSNCGNSKMFNAVAMRVVKGSVSHLC